MKFVGTICCEPPPLLPPPEESSPPEEHETKTVDILNIAMNSKDVNLFSIVKR